MNEFEQYDWVDEYDASDGRQQCFHGSTTNPHELAADLVGRADTIKVIEWAEPKEAWESGFVFVRVDDVAVNRAFVSLRTACFTCVCRHWPYLQEGTAIAMLHGAARLDHHGLWRPAV